MSKIDSVSKKGWAHEDVLRQEARLGCQHCCLARTRCNAGWALVTKLDNEGEGINGTKQFQFQGVKGLFLNTPAKAFQMAGADDPIEIAVN